VDFGSSSEVEGGIWLVDLVVWIEVGLVGVNVAVELFEEINGAGGPHQQSPWNNCTQDSLCVGWVA
jgi:hypothetical protein